MNNFIENTLNWIREDFHTNPIRFLLEVVAWAMSIGCAIALAATVPNPPLMWLYIVWVTGSAIYAWAAWTRKSFGMLANYLVLVGIDSVGLTRVLING